MADAGDFSLIVTSVEADKREDCARRFSKAFGLDETIAQQIVKSAPIIFAQKLTRTEIRAITPALTELSGAGIEFRVTSRVAGKLPKVNWPVRPQFTVAGTTGVNGLAFNWDNHAFICPGCGESFHFRRLGKLALAEAPANGPAPAEAKASRTAQPARAAVAASAKIGLAEEEAPAPQLEGVEGVQPLAGEGEPLDLPEAQPADEVRLDDLPDAPAAAEPELMPEEPAIEEISEEPAPAEDFAASAEEAPAEPEAAAEPEVEEAPPEEAAPVESGDLYNVFLSKITDTSKRDKAAELISKVKGCSTPEAKELTTRLVIPLAKNVPKQKAEDILNQFKRLKIFGRMTKVK
jgi:hypothetical protein